MIRRPLAALAFGALLLATPALAAPFTPEARARALDHIAQTIQDRYVYKDKAAAWAAEVRGWKNDPELVAARDERTFASIITDRLKKHDAHFNLRWSAPAAGAPAGPAPGIAGPQRREPSPEELAAYEAEQARDNYGFETVQRLQGNVGYIKLNSFADFDTDLIGDKAPGARRTAEAALAMIGNTDAVIFDLRDNGGGSPAMIDLLLAGFFGDKPVLLNRFYQREGDQTIEFTTLGNYTGKRRPAVPVFVLTSGRTGSAAEEFAYDVKTQQRGVLVGESTAGAANPGRGFPLGDGFSMFVSTGAANNPITGTNWEAVGVAPDVAVPAAEALDRAHELALQAVLDKSGAGPATTEARWTLERLTAERKGVKLTAAQAQAYAGEYGERRVVADGAVLSYQRGRRPAKTLIPLGDDAFALDGAPGLRVTFEREKDGRIAALVITDTDGQATSDPRH